MNPLSEKLQSLNDQIKRNRFQWRKNDAQSFQARVQRQLRPFYVFAYQFSSGCVWIYNKIINPLISPFKKAIKKLWRWYRLGWDRIVIYKDEFGIERFSKIRAGLMIMITAGIFYCVPIMFGLTWDTIFYVLTVKHNEELFLHNAQEIIPHENTFSIRGCDILPCSDQESIYFRVRSDAFNQLWSLFHHHSIFFPDFVAGAVPSVVSKCIVTSYGVRWKLLIRGLDIYPDLLEVKSCTPTTYIMPN